MLQLHKSGVYLHINVLVYNTQRKKKLNHPNANHLVYINFVVTVGGWGHGLRSVISTYSGVLSVACLAVLVFSGLSASIAVHCYVYLIFIFCVFVTNPIGLQYVVLGSLVWRLGSNCVCTLDFGTEFICCATSQAQSVHCWGSSTALARIASSYKQQGDIYTCTHIPQSLSSTVSVMLPSIHG